MASKTKLSMPRAICCARMTPGNEPSTQMKISAASVRAKPIGMPPTRQMTNPTSMSTPAPGSVPGENVLQAISIAARTPTNSRAMTMSARRWRRKSSSANTAMQTVPKPIG